MDSRNRNVKPPDYRRNESGAYLCVWRECGKVLHRKMKYCSDACQREVYIRCYPGWMRDFIEKRDKGVCAKCGCDTAQLVRVLKRVRQPQRGYYYGHQDERMILALIGFNAFTSHLWEADHIVQWSDGGSNEPENIRTLCLPCHKVVTAEYAATRARRKRKQLDLFV